jgi:hydrogenase maturation protease
MAKPTTLVLGIGNTLLSDEGIGVHVIQYLEAANPHRTDVTLLDGGTLSFTLADMVATHPRLIVVDAARTGSQPGSVCCFEGEAMDRYLKGNRRSVHEVGLTDLLDIARLSDSYPVSRALVGIEPQSLDWGEKPSPAVAEAIPEAASEILRLIDRWDKRDER